MFNTATIFLKTASHSGGSPCFLVLRWHLAAILASFVLAGGRNQHILNTLEVKLIIRCWKIVFEEVKGVNCHSLVRTISTLLLEACQWDMWCGKWHIFLHVKQSWFCSCVCSSFQEFIILWVSFRSRHRHYHIIALKWHCLDHILWSFSNLSFHYHQSMWSELHIYWLLIPVHFFYDQESFTSWLHFWMCCHFITTVDWNTFNRSPLV